MIWRRAALAMLLACCARAGTPSFEGLVPAGGPRGTTNLVTLFGKFDPWPPKIWASGEGLGITFETNKGKVQVAVAADAKPGPRLLRIYNDEGASEVRFFVVGDGAEVLEQEPNDHFRKAQTVTNLNVTVNGRLEKNGDVDSFAVTLKTGEWLDARLDSYTLMSKLDPVLRLLGTNGFQIAWNHDFGSLDPRLVWRSPADQTVILQVFGFVYPANAEIQLSGGPGGFYRLALKSGGATPIGMTNDEASTKLTPGCVRAGAICPGGDEDRYTLALTKDQWIEARVEAFAIGSPLDPWLAIQDSAGKELARNDDADNSRDPRLEWKAPADGDYALAIGSITGNAREDFRYELRVRELFPGFAAKVAEDNFTLTAGATNEIKLSVERQRGFTNALAASFPSLPEGVSGPAPVEIKGGDAVLPLVAATNAAAWSGPVRLVVKDLAGGTERPARFELVSRTENNGVPGGYLNLAIDSVEDLWLTVRPAEKK